MRNAAPTGLRIVLMFAGAFALVTGLDQALGGLATLGWMGQPDFYAITDRSAFLVADNHQRFLGGIWTGIGVALFVGLTNLPRYEDVLRLCFGLVFVGGLARFSQMNLEVTFGPAVLGSLATELIGMPLLVVWLRCVVATDHAGGRWPS